ncbi:MAG: hypothetical protein PT119_11355 [Aphanizomenon gracile PMC627.10]|nr:hypothetical protein [Aphanizomenon gracile PMC627.10]
MINLKEKLRNIKFLRYLYAKLLSHGNFFKFQGNNNICDTKGAILKQCSVEINGNNNVILIEIGSSLEGVKIFMRGENLKLHIGRSVFIGKGSVLWMQNNDGILEIGEYSSIEKAGIAVAEGKKSDIGLVSGCLEYIENPELFIFHLVNNHKKIAISYCLMESI